MSMGNEPRWWRDDWPLKMALRDARHNISRLLLFAASLITGVAALVAIGSLNESLQRDLDRNARELLGADVVASANRAFEPELISMLDSLPDAQARSAEMASMAAFPKAGQARLIRLQAVEPAFPFYGAVETVPEKGWSTLSTGGVALLDETLGTQYGVAAGDSVKVCAMVCMWDH